VKGLEAWCKIRGALVGRGKTDDLECGGYGSSRDRIRQEPTFEFTDLHSLSFFILSDKLHTTLDQFLYVLGVYLFFQINITLATTLN